MTEQPKKEPEAEAAKAQHVAVPNELFQEVCRVLGMLEWSRVHAIMGALSRCSPVQIQQPAKPKGEEQA
jgi:hypothetical protein